MALQGSARSRFWVSPIARLAHIQCDVSAQAARSERSGVNVFGSLELDGCATKRLTAIAKVWQSIGVYNQIVVKKPAPKVTIAYLVDSHQQRPLQFGPPIRTDYFSSATPA